MRTVREPQWTPRQREVLDLLVRGNTNSEIAQRLGISLDGAKWHVSEIITRLGVDSRDEAAEYWRHHNGMRMRFSRVMAGLFSSGALKWGTATAFVAGVVVVSAMVIVAMRENSGDQSEPTAGNPPSDTPSDVTPPANQPTAVATPPPTGETIAGVPVGGISFTQPGSLPVPMSVVIEKGCFQCDGPASAFERVTLDAQGQLVTEQLFEPDSGYISHSYWDSANRTHYLSVCSRGYCGGVGQVSADAQTTILRSIDGGVTWQTVQTFDGDVGLAAATQQGFLLNRSTFSNGVNDYRFQILGTDTVVRPPAGAEPEFRAGTDNLIGWRKTGTNELLKLDGTALVTLPAVGNPQVAGMPRVAGIFNDEVLVTWVDGTPQSGLRGYLGIMRNGVLATIFQHTPTAGTPGIFVGNWLTKSVVFGSAWFSPTDIDPSSSNSTGNWGPVMLDLQTGQMTVLELYGPAFSDAYAGQRNYIREVEPGPFLRVTGAGDCLNVREQAATSAKSLGCFADNVLLKDLAAEEQSGGVTWKKVATPGGQEGWASAEFLR